MKLLLSVSLLLFAITFLGFAAAVTNLDTGETFTSIQAAIDDPNTLNGHTIEVNSSQYDSGSEPGGQPWGSLETTLILVNKELTIRSTAGASETVVNGTGHNIVFGIKADHVTIEGFTITGAEVIDPATYLYSEAVDLGRGRSDVHILGNQIVDNASTGIWAENSTGCWFESNLVANHGDCGISIEGGSDATVKGNVVQGNSWFGIRSNHSDDCTIINNIVTGTTLSEGEVWGAGINLSEVDNNYVRNNVVTDNADYGIEIWGCSNCEITGNTVSGSILPPGDNWGGHGIEVCQSHDTLVEDNTTQDNEEIGIVINGSSYTSIQNNDVLNNGDWGINIHSFWEESELKLAHDNELIGNTVSGNQQGLVLGSATDNTIDGNTFSGSQRGIALTNSVDAACSGNLIQNNTIHNNEWYGITLSSSVDQNDVLNNEIYGTYISGDGWVYGIGILSTGLCGILNEGNVFSGNYVHDNAFGILVTEATDCEVTNNTVENNNTGDFGVYSILSCSDTEWWELVAHIAGGGGIHVNGPDNTVAGNTITGNGFGIMLQGGDGLYATTCNEVSNNTVSNNTAGNVSLFLSKYEWIDSTASTTSTEGTTPKISDTNPSLLPGATPEERARSERTNGHWENTVFEHLFDVEDFGLFLLSSSSTQVQNNTFTANGESGVRLQGFSAPAYGWEIGSNNNTVSQAEIEQHEEGAWIGPQAQDNLIYDNTIQNNTSIATGVKVEEAQGNVLYCNRIVNNGPHGVENTDAEALEAYYNWWGSANGPGADGANGVIGNVLYDPWLTSTECTTPAVFRVEAVTGNVLADGSFHGQNFLAGAADIAEWVSVSEPVQPGDVLEFDPDNPGHYRKSREPCSNLVAGVVSTDPGFVLGSSSTDYLLPTTHPQALLALVGIAPVKVTDEGGPIQPGDLLVASSTPGYAMRWDPDSAEEECGVIGKALEEWEGGTGKIEVLLAL